MPSDTTQRPNITGKLGPEERRTLTIPTFGTVETHSHVQDVIYYSVPSGYAGTKNVPVWRVLLRFGKGSQSVAAGLDVHADTVIGRGSGEAESPDVDLTNLGALEHGVSRAHALLRPTRNSLYVIDLNSTNGTYVNTIPLNHGAAAAIHNRDRIAFAGLICVVEIVSSPSNPTDPSSREATSAEIQAILQHGKPKTGTETIIGVKLELPDRD
jgi:pSer/pThr/pTyr-binding forkhead associated (FHA) protein